MKAYWKNQPALRMVLMLVLFVLALVLVMLPTLILYICVQKQLTQGMTVGGLKG